jgi:hypothetical protein
MSASKHVHEWGPSGEYDLRCVLCGASHSAIQNALGEAAEDARGLAGATHYTGCWVRQESEALELWLFDAPAQLLHELEAARPGVYVIDDAPRPLSAVDDLRDSFDWAGWKATGIKVSGVGPTQDGCLSVGVVDDVEAAQKMLDEAYGANVVRVIQRGYAIPCSAAST